MYNHAMCGRDVVKTPIKTIAKMYRVFDAPLFHGRKTKALAVKPHHLVKPISCQRERLSAR